MKLLLRFLMLAALGCCAGELNSALAQEREVANTASTKDLETSTRQYLIGSGDVLDIRVYNRPQLSRETVRVDGQGMIRMPLIKKRIQAICRTDTNLADAISKLYSEYLRYPHVEVFIKEFQSKPVTVFGAIREPGRFQMRRQIRLLELMSLAGGPTELAGGRIQIRHDLSLRKCEESGSKSKRTGNSESNIGTESGVDWYDSGDLLGSNKSSDENNPVIRPGDIVTWIEADKIYVIGNVFRPTTIARKYRVTLTQALAMAGGVMQDTNLDRIRVSRPSGDGVTRIELIADLKAINKKEAEDIVLKPNDIVEVRSSRTKKFLRGLVESIAPGVFRLPIRVIR
jgi:polysaccharide export outer membrane protein